MEGEAAAGWHGTHCPGLPLAFLTPARSVLRSPKAGGGGGVTHFTDEEAEAVWLGALP